MVGDFFPPEIFFLVQWKCGVADCSGADSDLDEFLSISWKNVVKCFPPKYFL
jgi:hypothetical protein